jgi:F-type H+-transporting ATPase subunit gamma
LGAKYREIKKRIAAIRKTQKIVSAMRMVSAAKLARATRAIVSARPYAEKMQEVLASVAGGLDPDAHPLLVARTPSRKLDVVVFTSDRGLCGAYNTNVCKRAEALLAERRAGLAGVNVITVGRKASEFFRRRRYAIPRRWTGLGSVTSEQAGEIAGFLSERYLSGEADEVVLVYSVFHSALSQRPGQQPLLPLQPGVAASGRHEVEPSPERLLALLVPRAIQFAVFRALLENQAGEHGARMTAMENATNNTDELIRSLTIEYNKARQSAITAELVEIVSGAEAL